MNTLVNRPGIMTQIKGQDEAETLFRPQTEEEFNQLPSGSIYIDPDDGKRYRKP